ncbi:hypothetical protein [Ensifer aridi]|uniref:hypothetical protein n=1 Tax=Ensifer aridi TaxID=1708715 RepID=UPI0003FD7786|nr:hypothetical protein [Ensifer aridi]
MRSFIKTSAMAAIALSLAAGGAFAAEHHGHEDRGISSSGPYNGDYYQGILGDDGAATAAQPVFRPTATVLPRGSHAQLQKDVHRLEWDLARSG